MYNFRQFSTVRRKPEVIKKKYIIVIFIFLAKEKEKIDGIKRGKRGGPPSGPSLTPCEEALMKSLEGRPVCSGVPGGGGGGH